MVGKVEMVLALCRCCATGFVRIRQHSQISR